MNDEPLLARYVARLARPKPVTAALGVADVPPGPSIAEMPWRPVILPVQQEDCVPPAPRPLAPAALAPVRRDGKGRRVALSKLGRSR